MPLTDSTNKSKIINLIENYLRLEETQSKNNGNH